MLALVFTDDPEAWGNARAEYEEATGNLRLTVNAEGGLFGPERVKGQPFSAQPATFTVDISQRAQRSLGEAMFTSALLRGAIAPMWDMRTAKMHQDAASADAGLSEEERAANGAGASATAQSQMSNVRTVTLEAGEEGTRQTQVGAGIRLDDSSGSSVLVITQVQSEQTVLAGLNHAPTASGSASAGAVEDQAFSWTVPQGSSTDDGAVSSLAYSLAQPAAKAWLDGLSWDAQTNARTRLVGSEGGGQRSLPSGRNQAL